MGFTLIELLAVIVILAIISVVVTPLISGVINDAKREAAERSVEGYVKAINIAQIKYQGKSEGRIAKSINELSVEASGKDRITTKKVAFAKTGVVKNGTFVLDGFKCNYSSDIAKCRKLVGASVNIFTHVIENTWEEINDISAEIALDESITSTTTTAHGYSIGDMKDFKVGEEVVTAVIIGFNHDPANGEYGISFMTKNCLKNQITEYYLFKISLGWADMPFRTYINDTLYNSIQTDLKENIKSVNKITTGTGNSLSLKKSSDKLWLLSYTELGKVNPNQGGLEGQGNKYPIFVDDNSRIKLFNGTSKEWALRSTDTFYTDRGWYVGKTGYVNNCGITGTNYGIAFGFTITGDVSQEVINNQYASLKVYGTPKLTYKPGEDFDFTGFIIKKVTYGGTETAVSNYNISGEDNLVNGINNINISYTDDKGITKNLIQKIYVGDDAITMTWAEIANISRTIALDNNILSTSMEAHGLKVGDKKLFNIGTETVVAKIAGFNHDPAKNEYGITFTTQDSLDRAYSLNYYNGTNKNWDALYIRGILNNEIYNNISSDLKNVIKNTTKLSSGDKLWLFSRQEVGFSGDILTSDGQQIRYPVYTNDASRKKKILNSYGNWWLRDDISVDGAGKLYSYSQSILYGISFGFCIDGGVTQEDINKQLSAIKITKIPDKITYKPGEDFDRTGMIVKKVLYDSTEEEITNYIAVDGTSMTSGQSTVTISYTDNNNVTRVIKQNIIVGDHAITLSWAELKELSKEIASDSSITLTSTEAHGLKLGDVKTFPLDNDYVIAYIAGFNHDIEKGETGITFICKYGNVTQRMTSGSITGGYKASEMYAYLNTIVLPFDVKTVKKEVDSGYPNFEVSLSDETKWLLSYQETGTTYTGTSSGKYQVAQGTPYPYLTSNTIRSQISQRKFWWTRSSFTDTSISKRYYWALGGGGGLGANLSSGLYSAYGEPYRSYSVVFAFNV